MIEEGVTVQIELLGDLRNARLITSPPFEPNGLV
jgi:hypothetical protein